MNEQKTALKVTCNLIRPLVPLARAWFGDHGLHYPLWSPGRMVLASGRGAFFPWERESLEDLPIESCTWYAKPGHMARAGNLAKDLGLHVPGRGSIMVEEVVLQGTSVDKLLYDGLEQEAEPNLELDLQANLAILSCVVDRGRGNNIARVILESGMGVPWVQFGRGTGLKERLGLIRVTIPAEKDLVHVLVAHEEVEHLVQTLVLEARLNQPGQGFLYVNPVSRGLVDTRLSLKRGQELASMEQVVRTLDLLTGGPEWRRRSAHQSPLGGALLPNDDGPEEVEIVSYAPEGMTAAYVEAARMAGIRGATMQRVRCGLRTHGGPMLAQTAMEAAHMVVPDSLLAKVLSKMDEVMEAGDPPQGLVWHEIQSVSKSFVYRT